MIDMGLASALMGTPMKATPWNKRQAIHNMNKVKLSSNDSGQYQWLSQYMTA